MCMLSILSRRIKRIIKEIKKRKNNKSLLQSTRSLEKARGETFYRYVLKFIRDRYG